MSTMFSAPVERPCIISTGSSAIVACLDVTKPSTIVLSVVVSANSRVFALSDPDMMCIAADGAAVPIPTRLFVLSTCNVLVLQSDHQQS